MGVDEEFERVRTSLRAEEQTITQELGRIETDARATVDATVERARADLATQADRIREAIAQQREEVEARSAEFSEELANAEPVATPPADEAVHVEQTDGTEIEQSTTVEPEPVETIGEVERGD